MNGLAVLKVFICYNAFAFTTDRQVMGKGIGPSRSLSFIVMSHTGMRPETIVVPGRLAVLNESNDFLHKIRVGRFPLSICPTYHSGKIRHDFSRTLSAVSA